jgi:2-methylcitrate dehydratase PrpD
MGLEAPDGLLGAMSTRPDPDRLIAPVVRWAIERTAIRLYAASGFAHAAMEAAVELAGHGEVAAITRVRLAVSPAARTLAGVALPITDEQAWWSVQHAVATCLVHRDPAVLESGLQDDPRVLRLLGCAEFDGDHTGIGATVTVDWADGRRQTASVDVPIGHPDRPATADQLLAKWTTLAGGDGERMLAAAGRLGSETLRKVVQEAGMADGGGAERVTPAP